MQVSSGPGSSLIVELHAPKGQRTLFDESCTNRKGSEMDGQSKELWIHLNPNIGH